MLQQNDDGAAGQESVQQEQQASQEDARNYEAELKAARQEAAKWRTKLRETQGKVKEFEPIVAKFQELEDANKGETEKLAEKLAALEGQLTRAQSQAQRAVSERTLTVLATKAGVPAGILPLLDVSKFDLENEEATIEALSALVPAKSANSGGSSNPARSQPGNTSAGADELRDWYTGQGSRNYIFGDK